MSGQNTEKKPHVITPKWLDYDDIRPDAESLAKQYFKRYGEIKFPIEPELLLGWVFDANVVPEYLPQRLDVRAALTPTLKTVYIDERLYMSDSQQHLVRQTLGHETGHIIYHRKQIVAANIQSVEDALRFHQLLTGPDHRRIEIQANIFAGSLLVPHEYISASAARLLYKNYELYRGENYTIRQLVDALGASKLAHIFGVSDDVISWRLDQIKLHEQLEVDIDAPVSAIEVDLLAELARIEPKLHATPKHNLLTALGFANS